MRDTYMYTHIHTHIHTYTHIYIQCTYAHIYRVYTLPHGAPRRTHSPYIYIYIYMRDTYAHIPRVHPATQRTMDNTFSLHIFIYTYVWGTHVHIPQISLPRCALFPYTCIYMRYLCTFTACTPCREAHQNTFSTHIFIYTYIWGTHVHIPQVYPATRRTKENTFSAINIYPCGHRL